MRRGSLVAVLIGVMLTQECDHVDRRPEAALHADLAQMRHAIGDYRAKHGRNPSSLNDLVTDGELRLIPTDPITHSSKTWKTTVEEKVSVDDFQPGSAKAAPSMVDVHSGASGSDSTGRLFADY